jgi:ubiquinol-cytochrome c reductase cytochrome c subunit
MRARLLLALAILVTLTAAVAGYAQSPSGVVHPEGEANKPLKELGAELYAGNCASCHGSIGQGVSTPMPGSGAGDTTELGPDLRGVGAIAPDFYLRTGRMPLSDPNEVPERGRPDFSGHEIRALTAYIASLGDGPPIPHPRPKGANVANGFHLFTESCAGCHQVAGEGGYVTDTRVPVLQHATPTQIAEAVRIGPYLMPSFSRKDISPRELDAIVAYVDTTKHPNDAGGLGIGHIGPVPEGIVAWFVAFVLAAVCAVIGRRART